MELFCWTTLLNMNTRGIYKLSRNIKVIFRLYKILSLHLLQYKTYISWCCFLCSNVWSQEERVPFRLCYTFSKCSGYLISLWILSQLVNFYIKLLIVGSSYTHETNSDWQQMFRNPVVVEVRECGTGAKWKDRPKETDSRGAVGTRLLWLGVLSWDVGRLKESILSSLTEMLGSLWETFPPSWEQSLLGLVREEKFAFNPELILSLIFIHPAWAS